MTPAQAKQYCAGCRNDFYNGNNNLGVEQCWSVPDAKLIMRRRVHINERPPWERKPERLPNCYHQPEFIFVRPDQER